MCKQIQHMYRCARVQGLDTSEGLLLFGKEHFYVIDGFTMTVAREIRDIETLPAKWDPKSFGCRDLSGTNWCLNHSSKNCFENTNWKKYQIWVNFGTLCAIFLSIKNRCMSYNMIQFSLSFRGRCFSIRFSSSWVAIDFLMRLFLFDSVNHFFLGNIRDWTLKNVALMDAFFFS